MPLFTFDEPKFLQPRTRRRTDEIERQTILEYQKQGLTQAAEPNGNFNDESLYTLRRIEQLRCRCGANSTGIRVMLDLMDEVKQLKVAHRVPHHRPTCQGSSTTGGGGHDHGMGNPLFPFPDRLSSVFSALGEKSIKSKFLAFRPIFQSSGNKVSYTLPNTQRPNVPASGGNS